MNRTSFAGVLRHLSQLAESQASENQADDQLLTRYLMQKDERAFAALVSRHGPMVWGVCQRVLQHGPDADDAFQATFLLLTRKAGFIRKRESVGSWLHGAAYRIAAKARCDAARRHKQERLAGETQSSPVGFEAAWRELQGVLDEELQRLPPKQRAALLLCYLEGRTHDEAARHLGWPVGTVKSTLARARERLRRRLTQRGLALSGSAFVAFLAVNTASAGVSAFCKHAVLKIAASSCQGGAAAVSAKIAALAQAGAETILATKIKMALACAVVLGMLGVGVAAWAPRPRHDGQSPPNALATGNGAMSRVKEGVSEAKDRLGDPLPHGALARLGSTRFRAVGSGQRSLTFTRDGKGIIMAGSAGPTRLWDLATAKLVRQFGDEFRQQGNAIALSADGRKLAGSGPGGSLRIWDVETGKLVAEGKGDRTDLTSLVFSADGKLVASSSSDKKLQVYDADTGKGKWTSLSAQEPVTSIAFDADGKTLAAVDGKSLYIWDVATGQLEPRQWTPKHRIASAVFLPDGRTMAAACGPLTGAKDHEFIICLVNVATLKEMGELAPEKENGFVDAYQSLAIAPGGKILAAANGHGEVRLWDLATGKESGRCQGGRIFASALAFSDNGKWLAGIDRGLVRLWEATSGKEKTPTHAGHKNILSSVAFTPDGASVMTASCDSSVRLWDAATGEERKVIAPPVSDLNDYELTTFASALCSDGKSITMLDLAWPSKGKSFGLVIRRWDRDGGRELSRTFKELNSALPGSMALAPNGEAVACILGGEGPQEVLIWESATGKLLSKPKGNNAVFSKDGKFLATSHSGPNKGDSLTLWDTNSGKALASVEAPEGSIYRIEFSPQGKLLATASLIDSRHVIHLWPLETGPADPSGSAWHFGSPRVFLKAIPYWVWALAFSPDGRMVAIPDDAGSIRVLETATGQERGRFVGHVGEVRTLAFSPDGRRLVSGGFDTTALVWDVTGRLQGGRLSPASLSAQEQEELWAALAQEEAGRASRAIWAFASNPERSVPFLAKQLRPTSVPMTPEAVAQLIRGLDDDSFEVRAAAHAELKKLGEIAEPALRLALEKAPSLEAQRRLKELLAGAHEQREHPSGEVLRGIRAVEVLGQIGTPNARDVLKNLANGPAGSSLTQEAKAACERLRE